jgi:2-keto-3-deoxy-L-rhamnonate aldolase RhmA
MESKSFAERLRAGERLLAASATISPVVAEMLGRSGFDWLFIDAEAFPLTMPEILELVRASELAGASPVVRMNNDDPSDIRQILDMGAAGVIIPLVKTAAQARGIVEAARFAPLGTRGVTAGRSRLYGYGENAADYVARANRETAVIVMVEEEEGLGNVAEIAAVDGLDGIFVGPGDMTISLGCPNEPMHADMQSAFKVIASAARANKVAIGTFPSSREMYDLCYEAGYRFFLTGLDTGFVKSAATARLEEMRNW